MPSEFALIARYFTRPAQGALLGVGDDCALLQAGADETIAITTDMLVEGTHFLPQADARLLGHKSLAVNLSDLAAMGAQPRWCTLALALPGVEERWLAEFSAGLYALADRHGIELIGGDTTRGPLTISITALGTLPTGTALRRDGAQLGDDIWVSGNTGEAALGLAHSQARVQLDARDAAHCLQRMHAPSPRVALGLQLRGIATSAVDVSDGLLADLGHILERSQVGAEIDFESLPRSAALNACPDQKLAAHCLVAGGDDYELVFSAGIAQREAVLAAGRAANVAVTRIGRIVPGGPVPVLRNAAGRTMRVDSVGFDHFK